MNTTWTMNDERLELLFQSSHRYPPSPSVFRSGQTLPVATMENRLRWVTNNHRLLSNGFVAATAMNDIRSGLLLPFHYRYPFPLMDPSRRNLLTMIGVNDGRAGGCVEANHHHHHRHPLPDGCASSSLVHGDSNKKSASFADRQKGPLVCKSKRQIDEAREERAEEDDKALRVKQASRDSPSSRRRVMTKEGKAKKNSDYIEEAETYNQAVLDNHPNISTSVDASIVDFDEMDDMDDDDDDDDDGEDREVVNAFAKLAQLPTNSRIKEEEEEVEEKASTGSSSEKVSVDADDHLLLNAISEYEEQAMIFAVEPGSKKGCDERKWIEKFKMLVVHKKKYGHCMVPERGPPDVMFQLVENTKNLYGCCHVPIWEVSKFGRWVTRQRRLYKCNKLREGRIMLLKKLNWLNDNPNTNEIRWEKMYSQLKAFKNKHGHTNVARVHDTVLGEWVVNQRRFYSKNKLKPNRVLMLDQIGFKWKLMKPRKDEGMGGNRDANWLRKYNMLVAFKQQYGHMEVSVKDDATLLNWIYGQRVAYRDQTIQEERKQLLDRIGFDWTSRAKRPNGCTS